MQYKISKILNEMLIAVTVIVLGLGVGYIFFRKALPEYKIYYIIGWIAVSLILFLFYKWMESTWDKRVITKMAANKKIALAHVFSGKRIADMRDSGFTRYGLYEFTAEIVLPDQTVIEKKFYEKMNNETAEIPEGWFYVTYDEKKPSQIFAIPNVMISHLPMLISIVAQYEKNKSLKIKYLDVYYNKGIVIQPFKQSVAQQSEQAKQRKAARK